MIRGLPSCWRRLLTVLGVLWLSLSFALHRNLPSSSSSSPNEEEPATILPPVNNLLLHETLCPTQAPLWTQHSPHLQDIRQWYHRIYKHQQQCTGNFIVVSLSNRGLGANVRLGLAQALSLGLATHRTVLVVNNSSQSESWKALRDPWPLASCGAWDCSLFRPISPCHLPPLDQNATLLTRPLVRRLFRYGTVEGHEHDRIWMVPLKFRPQRRPPGLPQEERSPHFYYHGRQSTLHAALVLYLLRPQKPLPSLDQQHYDWGLPIRASDKCEVESECFHVEAYRDAAQEWWWNKTEPRSVLVTSESSSILRHAERALKPPHYQLYTNPYDPGFTLPQQSSSTADQGLFSAVTSLRAQLQARRVLLNCCSNFHLLLADLLYAGCGQAVEFQCLQDHPNPRYRLRCGWDKNRTATS